MKVTLFISLFLFQLGFSQHMSCGTEAQLELLMNDSIAKQKHLDFQKKFNSELEKLQNPQNEAARSTNAVINIPIAVHFPSIAANSTNRECLRQLAQNQIDILNAAFSATNSALSLWTPQVRAFYPGTNVGNANMKFVLATKNHPAGAGLTNGQSAITFGTSFLNDAIREINWKGYLNIVVRDISNAGYYTGGTPNEGNVVVIKNICFGSGAGCPEYVPTNGWHLGQTLLHEVGHYFDLHHTFGKAPGDNVCLPSNTDYVDDTPQCLMTTDWGPVLGSIPGCVAGTKALTMNYMDYTLDGNKWMFTAGQVLRMRAYYNTFASQFATNVLLSNQDFEFKDFSLYPNPNTGSFKISFLPETNEGINIQVLDISGRNIYNKTFDNSGMFDQELQVNTISSGLYFVNIQNGNNKMIKRIVVE